MILEIYCRPSKPKQDGVVDVIIQSFPLQPGLWELLVGHRRIVEMFFDPILVSFFEHSCVLRQ